MKAIAPAQLDQWLAQAAMEAPSAGLPVVLDVREPWELQTASVRSAGFELRHIPMRSVSQRLDELDRDLPIACLCHHGMRSAQVANFLIDQGFTRVVNIHGGIHAWSQERDPGVPFY